MGLRNVSGIGRVKRQSAGVKPLSLSTAACVASLGLGSAFISFSNDAAAQITAIDQINVVDLEFNGTYSGLKDTETDYVPNSIHFENGAASFEALKAQAVAARTFGYFQMQQQNFITNGTNDQVYFIPGRGLPQQIHFDAAAATAGEVLSHPTITSGETLAAFYVAGGIPTNINDLENSIGSDPTSTENFVTYNSGNVGNAVQTTTLGSPFNPKNRGAKSQNGADFLSDNSTNYLDILKYYYGADIQVEVALNPSSSQQFVKPLADFDDYGDRSGNTFAGHESTFAYSPTFSGSTVNVITANTTAERSTDFAFSGGHSQKIEIDYDESAGSDFVVRHVSGAQEGSQFVASQVGNVRMDNIGSIGFWLLTDDPGLEVSIALDDPGTGDRGIKKPVIADGQWHQYQWFLEEDSQWESWISLGDGSITDLFTVDSIQLFGSSDAVVYLDSVFWDPGAVIPEPATASLAMVLTGLGLTRRRRMR